jgi:hypothetical protein
MQQKQDIRGIGMTSARTRDRLVQRLKEEGIRSNEVLEQIRNVPRHLFVDEALASRAYEDTALPIGLGQTVSMVKKSLRSALAAATRPLSSRHSSSRSLPLNAFGSCN